MGTPKYNSRIVSDEEIRNYCKQHNISEEEAIKEALENNPPQFHKMVIETIQQIFHP